MMGKVDAGIATSCLMDLESMCSCSNIPQHHGTLRSVLKLPVQNYSELLIYI